MRYGSVCDAVNHSVTKYFYMYLFNKHTCLFTMCMGRQGREAGRLLWMWVCMCGSDQLSSVNVGQHRQTGGRGESRGGEEIGVIDSWVLDSSHQECR